MAEYDVDQAIRERMQKFETGRNAEDDSYYRAATDRTALIAQLDRIRELRRAAEALATSEPQAGLDVERLARALAATDKVIVDNDHDIVTDTGDIEEVLAALAEPTGGER